MLELPRGHHERLVHPLGDQDRLGTVDTDVDGGQTRMVDASPEARATHGVDDEMDARRARRVLDSVRTPGVENPGLAGGHVDLLIVALEANVGRGRTGKCTRRWSRQ